MVEQTWPKQRSNRVEPVEVRRLQDGSIAVGLNESRDAETLGSRVEVYDASGKSLFVHAFPDHRILSLTQSPAEGQLGTYCILLNQLSPIGILEEHAEDGRHWSVQVEASALDVWPTGEIAAVGRRADDWKRQQVTLFDAQGEAKGTTEIESPPNAMLSVTDIRVSREDTMVVAGTVLRYPCSSMGMERSEQGSEILEQPTLEEMGKIKLANLSYRLTTW